MLAALVGSLLGGHAVANDAVLRSPWDAIVTATTVTGSCPSSPALPADIDAAGFYSDPAHSVVDPVRKRAYDQSTRLLHDAAGAVETTADEFRANGSGAVAACAANWLDGFARSGVLTGPMPSNQATYVQGWMLSAFAIVWLKVRPDPGIPPAQRAYIANWLARVASLNEQYYEHRPTKEDSRNNHRYWAGVAVMAAGIAANREDLFDWGTDSFRLGVSQVASDGTLPLEIKRRSRALHYHLFAAAPLVTMAELARANGMDLYRAGSRSVLYLGGLPPP